ncbi:TPA: hypothetical protein HA244_01145 [Candidatus Micrarchaeota archaeon]|nr:hypothetical protein [Candidatus Micrarchaeota archaeon]
MKCACGNKMMETEMELEGLTVKGFKCEKCGEELFNPWEAERVRKVLNEQVKARKVAHSLVVTLPQPIAKLAKIKEGDKLKWLVSKHDLILSKT